MNTHTAQAIAIPKQMANKKRSRSQISIVRKEIRCEAKFITFIAHLNLLIAFSALVILGLLQNYLEEFFLAMENAVKINVAFSASITAMLVCAIACLMTVFAFIVYLLLMSSAQSLRKQASDLKEV